MRAKTSVPPPGVKGTTMRTVFSGHFCASAGVAEASDSTAAAKIAPLFISSLLFRSDPCGLHHLAPLGDLATHELAHLLGRAGLRLGALRDQLVAHLGEPDDAHDRAVQLADDLAR